MTRTTADRRMLEFMELLKIMKIVRSYSQFCREINAYKQDIKLIREGHMSFRLNQIEAAGKVYGANMNWVFGMEINIFRDKENTLALNKLLHRVRNGGTYNFIRAYS